jgi:hypothetical protein
MTNQQHPMVPPNILLNNWESDWFDEQENVDVLLIQAYQAGADAELEACCEWLASKLTSERKIPELRAARRPKLQSLKEQALKELSLTEDPNGADLSQTQVELIRRALEALPND